MTGLLILALFFLIFAGTASAHCPACTVGAGFAVTIASYLGVDLAVLGLLLGAFGVSTGWWISKKLSRSYVPYQKKLLVLSSFLLTVVPLAPMIAQKEAFFINLVGVYGSLLHNTYFYDASIITAIVGGLVVTFTPWISSKITELRGEHIDYQGIGVTFSMLIFLSVVIQVL